MFPFVKMVAEEWKRNKENKFTSLHFQEVRLDVKQGIALDTYPTAMWTTNTSFYDQ